MSDVVEIVTTLGSAEEAESMARKIVEERWAACAQWAPIRSCYRWEGHTVVEEEVQLTLKTRVELAQEASERVRAEHPYEVPAILVLDVREVNIAYSDWVKAEVQGRLRG